MNSCELCGRSELLKTTLVEGVTMQACESCCKHGTVLNNTSINHFVQPKNQVKTNQLISPRSAPNTRELKVVDNFSDLLRQKRVKQGLTITDFSKLLNERESLVAKWLNGSIKPDLAMAEKLQQKLKLRLLESEAAEVSDIKAGKDNQELTLGDIVIKNRKR